MARAIDAARYILHLAGQEPEFEPITQMRLHKLLYYVQAWSLVDQNAPLFPEQLRAWKHGPMVKAIRDEFSAYDRAPIPAPDNWHADVLSASERAIIESVWESYKAYSPAQLRKMTHHERPWREARGDRSEEEPSDEPMPQQVIWQYFEDVRAQSEIPGLQLHRIRHAEQELDAGKGIPGDQVLSRLQNAV